MAEFSGFPKEGSAFLMGLEKNNKKEWFDAHRDEYENSVLEPAKLFVEAMGQRLHAISKNIHAEPRVNGSIRRINRDVRFSKDKSPYKNHLDLQFWEGGTERCGSCSFLFRMYHDRVVLGVGVYEFSKPGLDAYRRAVVETKSGTALEAAAAKAKKAGYDVGGQHYKRVPSGFDPEHKRATYLLHTALYAGKRHELPADVSNKKFTAFCFNEYKKLLPLHQWLVDYVAKG